MSALEIVLRRVDYPPRTVLHDIDFAVESGTVVVVAGRNGSGKSTLLRAVAGIIPAEGRIQLGSTSLAGASVEERVRLGLAYVPQGAVAFDTLTVVENLRLGGALTKDVSELNCRVEELLLTFPSLSVLRHRTARDLSSGQRQQLALARALVRAPRALLLDEPCAGVARDTIDSIVKVIAEIAQVSGVPVLAVEHRIIELGAIADKCYEIRGGHLEQVDLP